MVLVVLALAGCVQTVQVDDGRVRVANGSYRAPVAVTSSDGHAFGLALRIDRTPNEVWAAALDGSGACSLGPVHGRRVWYGPALPASGLGVLGAGPGHSSLLFVVADFSNGFGTVRAADAHCHPVPPALDDVIDDGTSALHWVIDASGAAYALETRDGRLHLIDPWAGTDTVVVSHVAQWGTTPFIGAWAVAGGAFHRWRADGTEVAHYGTAVTEAAAFAGVGAYVEGGDVWIVDGSAPYRLTTGGDACGVRFLEDGGLAYFSPCARQRITIADFYVQAQVTQYRYGIVGSYGSGVTTVHAVDNWFFYATRGSDGSSTMWAVSAGGEPTEVGAWKDVTGALSVGSPVRSEGSFHAAPALSTVQYIGLQKQDGTSTWGTWDGAFHPVVSDVSSATSGPGVLVAMTDVRGSVGTLRVFAAPVGNLGSTTAPVLTVPNVGAQSVVTPPDEGALYDLERFDSTLGVGDLVVHDVIGHRIVIDHRATGYADVLRPVRGFIYTAAGGARAGMWLAVTGYSR